MSTGELDVVSTAISDQERQLVREALKGILESHQFCKSKRYPALIQYIVLNALEGNFHILKERTLGIEVLGRPADYDPSTDPSVRIAIREVRRRLTSYHHEHPESPVRIDLPLGGYIPEFRFCPHSTDGANPVQRLESGTAETHAADGDVAISIEAAGMRGSHKKVRWCIAAAAGILLCIAGWATWSHESKQSKQEVLWPILRSRKPVLVVIGSSNDTASLDVANAGAAPTSTSNTENLAGYKSATPPSLLFGNGSRTAMGDMVVSTDICGTFHRHGRECNIMAAEVVTLSEMRGNSVVLIGGGNNPWTQHLLEPLRYTLQFDPRSGTLDGTKHFMIVDRFASGNSTPWRAVLSKFGRDYTIIARFHSNVTGGIVVAAAGLAPEGTNSGGPYLQSPTKMKEILSLAPKGWNGTNFEAIVQADIFGGNVIGNTKVVATYFW